MTADKAQFKDVFVIMPAYNEEKNIKEILQEIISYNGNSGNLNIIVVDDGSKDNTYLEAKKVDQRIIVLKHEVNLGKGAALITGCEAALEKGAKVLALIDADRQHLAADMVKLIDKLIREKLDIVFGEREFNKSMPLVARSGNRLLTFLIKIFSSINLSDTQCGLRVFTVETYRKIKWQEKDYSVETEMIINSGKYNLKYGSDVIQTIYREKYKGTTVFDGAKIFLDLLKWRIRQ